MQRRNKIRNIGFVPGCTRFAAQGSQGEAGDVTIGLDMIEAMRLVDAENLSQQEAAASMGVSTPTLCRILGEARRRTITALLSGQNIILDGGNIMLTNEQENSSIPGQGRYGQGMRAQRGAGYGRGQGHGMGRAARTEEEGMGHRHDPGNNGGCGHGPDSEHGLGHHGSGSVVHYHYHYHYSCPAPSHAPMPESRSEAETVCERTNGQN